ncbi:hypothetical protein [Methylobacterium sp.]|uniref:hypothetical protein n=1 Tax=Methylobacterium sp. TaxID=409 RepID=UPI00258068D0|nr:hypothetical protein [Methylobacterium sp.]
MTASLNRAVFFDHVRKPLFGGSLTAEQVQGMDAIFDACPAALPTDPLAYVLATTIHETARTMQPIEEYGRGKGRAYGPTGFWGRGFVQLTWKANYAKATTELRKLGVLTASEDLVKTPALAMRMDAAATILFHGMISGWFTGKKLSDYFGHGKSDPKAARAIINGTDKAALIAGYFNQFRAALVAAKHGVGAELGAEASTPPVASVAPAKPKPVADKHAVEPKKPVPVRKRAAPVHHVVQKAKHR